MKKVEGKISVVDLLAYADDQLPPEKRGDVEDYLRTHAAAARRVATYRRQNSALHDTFDAILREPTPPRLQFSQTRSWALTPLKAATTAVIIAALGVTLGWNLNGHYNQPLDPQAAGIKDVFLARQASLAHAAYAPEVRHPVEVAAAEETHLTAWLSKRLGRHLKAPVLAAQGFSLVGGRLIPAEASGVAAQFMYENMQGQRLTLYVRAMVKQQPDTSFRYALENKVSTFYWIDRDWGYALSGDVDRQQLLAAAQAAYQQFNL